MYSQNIQFDCTLKYSVQKTGITADLTVTVTSGTPDYTFYLTTNNPVKGELLMKSDPVRKKSYTFRNVKPGKYFIKVEDKSGEQRGKTITISENENY
jgi:hypothetical protein